MSQTAYRTHHATEVTEALVGQKVTLAGWVDRRRDHGGVAFIDLRDSTGLVQVVIYDEDMARPLRSEFVIQVVGEVRLRPEGNENEHLATGKIEVVAESIEILAKSDALPFQVSTALENESENKLPGEDVRLKYRYLDLRRPSMQHNLKLRSDMTKAARHALEEMDFTEVETPTFIKSTPEGARDFVVPARLVPGSWYALPQSPQLLKQLLMIGGVERYYQVAKCFRDEDLRADRQPEFTQVDIEMAFVSQDDVMGALEDVLKDAFARMGVELSTPLRRISYWDAMDTYGIDKPDTRYGMHLVDVTDIFKNSKFKVFSGAANTEGSVVKCINAKGAGSWPRAQIDKLEPIAETFGAKGLAWIAFREDGSVNSPIVKFFSDEEMAALRERVDAQPGDLVMFAAGPRLASDEILGGMRCHMADALDVPREGHDFLWVVDFPLFHWDDERKAYASEHQPFTQPVEADIERLDTDPLSVGSHTYDFVMDGFEAGGGGMRIHNAELQEKILELLGFTPERAQEQFGFVMEALQFGAPPMGGFALGLDRVCMLLAGTDSIRDVMAFPKTASGSDLMSDAPSEVSAKQLKEVSIRPL